MVHYESKKKFTFCFKFYKKTQQTKMDQEIKKKVEKKVVTTVEELEAQVLKLEKEKDLIIQKIITMKKLIEACHQQSVTTTTCPKKPTKKKK